MIELNYTEAVKLAIELSRELEKEKKLRTHCEIHNLKYQNIIMFIRENPSAKKPKLILDFLESLGYSFHVEKKVSYCFLIEINKSESNKIIELIRKPN